MNQQKEILQWSINTFGTIASDKEERVKRFAEEAIELCQAANLDIEDLFAIVWSVYNKPNGAIYQELGQTALTLALLAEVYDLNANVEMACEFDRVRSFDKSYWQARQNRKAEMGIAAFCNN